jgi:aryl-alcohol dehydrogenase-like predicted oxidoreductase
MDSEGKLKGASRSYMFSAIEESLKRLKTDWIDLYLMHSPDPLTPIEETMEAFDELIRQGKVRYIGCSNTPAWGIVDANWTARAAHRSTLTACEDEYSLVNRRAEVELIPAALAHGIGLLPFYPLASGLLSGKYTPGTPPPAGSRFAKPERFETRFQSEIVSQRVEALRDFAFRRGHSLLELAMSWLSAQPVVGSIIAGATSPNQIEANVKASTWALSAEDLSEIDRVTK